MTERREGSEGDSGDPADLPNIDFATFVLSLSHSALVHLGEVPDESGARPPPKPELARQTIDLLGILEEKTRGNLTGEEERLLGTALYDLRLRFVQYQKAK